MIHACVKFVVSLDSSGSSPSQIAFAPAFRPGKTFRPIAEPRPRPAQRLCESSGQRRDLPVEFVFRAESLASGHSGLDDESTRLRTRKCTDIMPPVGGDRSHRLCRMCGGQLIVKVCRMNETITLELTKDQKEILLRGLRFVRSSIMLDINDLPTNESEDERRSNLRQVTELAEHVNRAAVMAH